MKEKTDNVLICPLNWGLGHAARCIPIIRELLLMNKKVVVAGNGNSMSLLQLELPNLEFVELRGVEINYNVSGFSPARMLFRIPELLISVWKEHYQLKQIILEHNIQLVISDNRYGCWSRNVKSVFITHQLAIKLPELWSWLSKPVNAVNHYFIRKFDECWVPDEKNQPYLSGELSHGNNELDNVKFVGSLSRFYLAKEQNEIQQFDVLVILSGPEPQRSILEVTLISELEKTDMTVLIIRGKPDDGLNPVPIGKIVFNNHLSAESIRSHLLKSKYIICRSGYSSLMDLAAVGRSAIIIPTPGQTEQEYLAEYHHQMGNHFYVLQEKPDLTNAFEGVKACKLLKLENISLAVAIKRIFQDKEILKDNN